MNIAITNGLELMPPPFSAGLNNWSRTDGTAGSGSYAGQPNAAYVPADADFGGCLELQKSESLQRLRWYGETPMIPGLYLQISARVKAVSGNLPAVRIAGWAGRSNNTNVGGIVQVGPSVALTSYGEVVTVRAIVAVGNRSGVDMAWGTTPVYGHFGLDLTGSNGGVVRIDDIQIEDVTNVFLRDLLDWVDVRDFGALGNGITDDSAAFAAADAAANGRAVLVSSGTYLLQNHVTFSSKVRFEGKVNMPAQYRLSCTRDFNLDTYEAAFGSEEEGFRRAIQALFYFTDHSVLDLGGRRVGLSAPVDVAAVAGRSSFASRRAIAHGQIEADNSAAWDDTVVTSTATYTPNVDGLRLTGVTNVANVPVGARISGTGVGREVYVRSKNVGAGTIELSRPLWGASGTRTFTFTLHKFLLDFSGFSALSRFELNDLEFQCSGRASGVSLSLSGSTNRIADCVFLKPKDKAITSAGAGCQGLLVDRCQFLSNEQPLPAQNRTSIALNVNANDPKIRENRVVRFAHFAVLAGSGNMIIGNHFFQGDDETAGVRRAGIVFTSTNIKTLVTGNYIDNSFLEWCNEHDAQPEFRNEFSFGGLTVTGNIFTCNDVASSFNWVVITPYGPGHFVNGFAMNNNVFRTVNCTVRRVEAVDTTHATLDYSRFRNLVMEANASNGVEKMSQSPVMIRHDQNTPADTWTVAAADFMPFGAHARNVQSVVLEGAVRTAGNVADYSFPFVETSRGVASNQINLRWPTALKGRAHVTVRCDNDT